MWSNALLLAYRTLTRHRLFAAINLLGLAVSLAAAVVLARVVAFEHSYDAWMPASEDIYRVNRQQHLAGQPPQTRATTSGALLPALQAEFPEIEAGARLLRYEARVLSTGEAVSEEVILADASLPAVFRLPVVAGDWNDALSEPTAIVLSEAAANRHFGRTDVVGRTLVLRIDGVQRAYRVSAVLRDLPANTHLRLDVVARLDRSLFPAETGRGLFEGWQRSEVFTYVRLRPGSDVASLNARLDDFVSRRVTGMGPDPTQVVSFAFAPIRDLRFSDATVNNAFKPGVSRTVVGTLGAVGLLLLLIAASNYVNLSTAMADLRAREVALRKVLGAERPALIRQFLVEACATVALAALLALALVELLTPAVAALLGQPLTMDYLGPAGAVTLLTGAVLVVGLGAGLYPAFVLSGFRPAAVLSASRMPAGGRRGGQVRQALVFVQFVIAVTLAIITLVVLEQSRFIRGADLGFDRASVVLIGGLDDPALAGRANELARALATAPGVQSATLSTRAPGRVETSNRTVSRPGLRGEAPTLQQETIGDAYFETYGVRMLAGRPLGRRDLADDVLGLPDQDLAARGLNVVLNAKAARALGWGTPSAAVGQTVLVGLRDAEAPAVVVGVAQDVRFLSPREAVPPLIYIRNTHAVPARGASPTLAVRVSSAAADPLSVLEGTWRTLAPGAPFDARTVNMALEPFYAPQERRFGLFTLGVAIAVLVGCVGLYGLTAFSTARRVREIGIRKTLGATQRELVTLFLRQALAPVVVANLVAAPLGFLAARSWLSGFDQRIALGPTPFLIAALGSLAIATGTVLAQIVRVTAAEPARALRHE